jgi:hypothetical protein
MNDKNNSSAPQPYCMGMDCICDGSACIPTAEQPSTPAARELDVEAERVRHNDQLDALEDLRKAVKDEVNDEWLLAFVTQYPFAARRASHPAPERSEKLASAQEGQGGLMVREAIERALEGVHIEDGTVTAFNRVVADIERAILSRQPVTTMGSVAEGDDRQAMSHADMLSLSEKNPTLASGLPLHAAPQPPADSARFGESVDTPEFTALLMAHSAEFYAYTVERDSPRAHDASNAKVKEARAALIAYLDAKLAHARAEGREYQRKVGEKIIERLRAAGAGQPELTVWYGPMPESNGKSNFTAILRRKDGSTLDGMSNSHTIARSEYPERVRYEADRVRHLIGELAERPHILDYDADKHSGYVEPVRAAGGSVEGIDLDKLMRFNMRGNLMNPERWGLYVRFYDVEELVASRRSAGSAPAGEAVRDGLRERVLEAWANYERMGEVCSFEGQPMIYASTLEEIATIAATPSATAEDAGGGQ